MAAGNGQSSGGPPGFTWEASEWPTFLHLDLFDDEWLDLGLGDGDLQELQSRILESPGRYLVVPGTGGLRKFRSRRHGRRAARAGPIASVTSGFASSASSFW